MESREFYFELCKLLNSLNNSYDKYAKRNGIVSNNLLWLVYALSDGKEHTQLEMCNHTSLPKTTVNTLIKDLENNQYVTLKKGIDKRAITGIEVVPKIAELSKNIKIMFLKNSEIGIIVYNKYLILVSTKQEKFTKARSAKKLELNRSGDSSIYFLIFID